MHRWLEQEYQLKFPPDKQPPVHMPIAYGHVNLVKTKQDCTSSLSQPVGHGVVGGGAGAVGGGTGHRMADWQRACQFCTDKHENVSLRGLEGQWECSTLYLIFLLL